MARKTETASRYEQMSQEELMELARERDITGRSKMSREELAEALEIDDLGPDALELLIEQHDAMRQQFEQFEKMSSRPSKAKDQLVEEMITDLVKHSEIEEQIFYPAVREEVSGLRDVVDEGIEEHHAAELLLAELDRMRPDAERYDAKVTVVVENVRHHMEEEEEDLFPKLREAWDEKRRRELGGAMQQAWRVAPTRPHPHAPDTPPANILLGIPTMILDVGRNVVQLVWRRVRGGR